MLTGAPWVRWPPAARSRPMKVSPGCSSARNTAWFIWLPEFGWTLANCGAEQFLGAIDRQRLGDVDPFATAIVARARIALGVFVGHHRALRFQHGAADDVFRGDQLDLVALPAEFALDGGGDFRIGLGEGGREERVGRGRRSCCWRSWAEISPPPQALRGKTVGYVWRSKEALARYHIGPGRPSTCGIRLIFMQDMVGMAGMPVPGTYPPSPRP